MPEIIFPSEYLKINENVKSGDVIQFLDAGKQNEEDGRWIFHVAVFRDGSLIEPDKKFGINKTNFKVVSALYGSNSDEWIHKEMKVESIKVRNPQTGLPVDSIALSEPPKKEEAKPAEEAKPEEAKKE